MRPAAGILTGLECVANVSEGRNEQRLAKLVDACGASLLDVHTDPDHHRSVFTLGGPGPDVEAAARRLCTEAVATGDLAGHRGAHPRFGVIDVVPFVPLADASLSTPRLATAPPLCPAVTARDAFARWAGSQLAVPCFLFGPLGRAVHRTLPEVRREAFTELEPDTGPERPHPRAGACAVGARHFLVAYNLWLTGADLEAARRVALAIRGPAVRSLAFALDHGVQVSCNLVDPATVGPARVYDEVTRLAQALGADIDHAELVGLVPAAVLAAVPEERRSDLGLSAEATIEARLTRGDGA
jgi:glutamate formiminotransferase